MAVTYQKAILRKKAILRNKPESHPTKK